MDRYHALLHRLYGLNIERGVELSLDRMQQLAARLEHPQQSYKSIHVAGSNGKGSVVTKLSGALHAQGFRVGLFTSPHISSFRERVRINGEPCSEAQVIAGLEAIFVHADLKPTFFEVSTMLAFLIFKEAQVDWAVIETGLGGRLDATNILLPEICAITSISLEHQQFLGDTLEQITAEKAGIIKPGVPLVIGPHVCKEWIRPRTEKLGCPLIQVAAPDDPWTDVENTAIAKAVLEQLSPAWADADLTTRPPCRYERLAAPGIVIHDVAHNPDGLVRLLQQCHRDFGKQLRCVVGLSEGKDLKACMAAVEAHSRKVYLLKPSHHRMASQVEVQAACSRPVTLIEAQQLTQLAQEAASAGEVLLICGSFFIMSAVRKAFGIDEPCDPLDLNEVFKKNQGRAAVSQSDRR